MTLNTLRETYAADDLNPNAELVFHIDTDEFEIEDIRGEEEVVHIYLTGR